MSLYVLVMVLASREANRFAVVLSTFSCSTAFPLAWSAMFSPLLGFLPFAWGVVRSRMDARSQISCSNVVQPFSGVLPVPGLPVFHCQVSSDFACRVPHLKGTWGIYRTLKQDSTPMTQLFIFRRVPKGARTNNLPEHKPWLCGALPCFSVFSPARTHQLFNSFFRMQHRGSLIRWLHPACQRRQDRLQSLSHSFSIPMYLYILFSDYL